MRVFGIAVVAALLVAQTAAGGVNDPRQKSFRRTSGDAIPASQVDFGDDASQWANDGECDDPRFQGPGQTTTQLLDSDLKHDATDCRTAYERGDITLRDYQPADEGGIDYGDDTSDWANDGECDDPRFKGPGMASPPILAEDEGHDATDCRTGILSGNLTLK